MSTYTLGKPLHDGVAAMSVSIKIGTMSMCIPFAPDNTDYVNFKSQINADEAQLEDADGVLMSPEAAKAFVATLP